MTALDKLTEHREKTPVDTATPIRPGWLADREAFHSTTALVGRRAAYRTGRFLVHLPALLALLVLYSPRGLGRLAKALGRYLYDYDSAEIRHQHAGQAETKEYAAAARIRGANLRARWMVAGTLGVLVLGPVLAWTFPYVLSGIVGVALFVWTVKLIPGRSAWELVAAVAVGVAVWWFLPMGLELIPAPPAWVWPLVVVPVVLGLGWHGRPGGKTLVKRDDPAAAGIPEKPTAPIVIDALCRLNITGLTDKTRDEVRVFAPGVARSRRGYHLQLEMPPGVTATAVMDKREAFAGAMHRELGTVWPRQGEKHPNHLELFMSDLPMNKAPQAPWPLAEGKPVDIFDSLPLFTDQEGQWVSGRFAYSQWVVGGQPGYGKTFASRELGVACAFDPRTRITVLDGKGFGDMGVFRLVAHRFFEGDAPEEIAEQLVAVRAIRDEMRRRGQFVRQLPREECPESKVTSELVDRYPDLAPIVLLVDEVQVYTEYEDKKIKDEFIALFTDLVKRGRAAGIIPIFCTQKPDASALPSAISDNCSTRLCFRVLTANANNQVLGNGMYAAGVRATLFTGQDKGLAWLRGDGDEAQVVRTVHGLDAVAAEELLLKARAIRDRRGLLTGDAAGEEAAREEVQADLLADCREVVNSPENGGRNMSLGGLRDRLTLLRPGLWGHLDVEALGSALRAAGVVPKSVHCRDTGKSSQGVKREWLEVAATSDVDPDDDGEGGSLHRLPTSAG